MLTFLSFKELGLNLILTMKYRYKKELGDYQEFLILLVFILNFMNIKKHSINLLKINTTVFRLLTKSVFQTGFVIQPFIFPTNE